MELNRTTQARHPLGQLSLMRFRIFVREPAALFWTYGAKPAQSTMTNAQSSILNGKV